MTIPQAIAATICAAAIAGFIGTQFGILVAAQVYASMRRDDAIRD